MIFFYDKHWYHTGPLQSVPEEDESDESSENEESDNLSAVDTPQTAPPPRGPSPTPSQETVTSVPASSAPKKTEYEFLLFNYLLRFVHREGKIGDFARAGLLFLMDVAMSPGVPTNRLAGDEGMSSGVSTQTVDPVTDAALALAEYILDGDFCEVLAAGLGAVYSLLPSKLEVRCSTQEGGSKNNGMVIGGTGPISEEEKERNEVAMEKARAMGVEFTSTPDFKCRLDHFLKLLEFLQDVLRRNVSHDSEDNSLDPSSLVGSAIAQSILDAVRRIFLENVLYTSILECSDADGSAVAVMTYIDAMVRALNDVQFVEMLIDFLASEDDMEPSRQRSRKISTLLLDSARMVTSKQPVSRAAAKRTRRKSSAMMLLEMEAPDTKRQSEYITSMGRFTIKDLLLSNFRSSKHTAVTSALQLMQALLNCHCDLAVERLLIIARETTPEPPPLIKQGDKQDRKEEDEDEETFVYPDADDTIISKQSIPFPDETFHSNATLPDVLLGSPEATFAMHQREVEMYLNLVTRINPSHRHGVFSTGYENYVQDAIAEILNHGCYPICVDEFGQPKPKHLLNPNDPLLSPILQTMRRFYLNSPQLNVALTGVLSAIAVCPDRSLSGWLLFSSAVPLEESGPQEPPSQLYDDGDDRSVDYVINERLSRGGDPLPPPIVDARMYPVIFSILQGLIANVDRYRRLVPTFDELLSERRQGLLFSENLSDALNLSFDLSSEINSSGVAGAPRVKPPTSSPQRETTTPKPKARSLTSAIGSFLSTRRNKTDSVKSASTTEGGSEQQTLSGDPSVDTSPFGSHYQKTNSLLVEPLLAPIPTSGTWMPSVTEKFGLDDEARAQWHDYDPSRTRQSVAELAEEHESIQEKRVTLSQLLDNVVILEECMKELVAIIHARRTLGIDAIRYL